jgi:hypothetical protein
MHPCPRCTNGPLAADVVRCPYCHLDLAALGAEIAALARAEPSPRLDFAVVRRLETEDLGRLVAQARAAQERRATPAAPAGLRCPGCSGTAAVTRTTPRVTIFECRKCGGIHARSVLR